MSDKTVMEKLSDIGYTINVIADAKRLASESNGDVLFNVQDAAEKLSNFLVKQVDDLCL